MMVLKTNKKTGAFLAFIILLISIATNCSATNPQRAKRHIGSVFKHLRPIIENPFITEPLDLAKPDSDLTTIPPGGEDSPGTEIPGATSKPSENPESASNTEVPPNKVTDLPSSSSTDAPSMNDTSEASTGKSNIPDSQSESASTMTPDLSNQEKLADEPTATTMPGSDSESLPKPDEGNTKSPRSDSESVTTPKEDLHPTNMESNLPTEVPSNDPTAPSNANEQTTKDPKSTPSSETVPNSTPPASDELPAETPSEQLEAQTSPGDAQKPTTPATNFRKSKSSNLDSEDMPQNETTENPLEILTTNSPNSDEDPNVADMITTTPRNLDDKSSSNETSPSSTTEIPSSSTTEVPGSTESTPEENLDDEIDELLEKLNNQKRVLDEQIAESQKALEDITQYLNRDKNRRVDDVINRVQDEEVKPLARELNQNTSEYDQILDPEVVANANETERAKAKQWIVARIAIPMHFQLMQSYLGLKMASPSVKFPQRIQVISLFNEAHIDCLRNKQYHLRGPLEAMLVKMVCITKSTDPGKLPSSWQPNNYLNRAAGEQIQNCNQPEYFYSTKPYGRNTIIFRRIQDNFEDGIGTFQNMQQKISQHLNLANQEITQMKQQCIRQQQLQMESEQVPAPSNTYLPAPNRSRWNSPDIGETAASVQAPQYQPTGQWYVGQWRPSNPGPRVQRWS